MQETTEGQTTGAGEGNRRQPAQGTGVVILIPAYNEAGRVGRVVAAVRRELPAAQVVVIDDGSKDGTAAEARAAGALAISLPLNCGYGTALQTGYKYAVRYGYGVIGQIDADGQHRAEYLREMVGCVARGEADLVVGSRFLAKDGHYHAPFARSLGIKLFGRLASFLTGRQVTDPTSGYQVMSRRVAALFAEDFPVDYPDADVLILLHRTGFRVRELAVKMLPSPGRSMHSGHSTPYYVYKMLLSILVTLLRPVPPR